MKEEDLSAIKRYPIVEYLERKGIKPVRRTSAYIMYRSPAESGNASELQGGRTEEPMDRLWRGQRRQHHRPLYAYGGLHAAGSHLSLGTDRFP